MLAARAGPGMKRNETRKGRILFLGEKKGGEDSFGAEKGGRMLFLSKENTVGQYFVLF